MIRLAIVSFFLCCTVMGNLDPIESSEESENQHNISKRVIGGDTVTINQFPFLVSILKAVGNEIGLVTMCSGSIISKTIVLTAAHCLYRNKEPVPASSFRVRSGSSDFDFDGNEHRVLLSDPHENFDINGPVNAKFDLGLMYVYPSFKFGVNVRIIPLAAPGYGVDPNTMATIIGWGADRKNGQRGLALRSASLKIMDTKECSSLYGENGTSIGVTNNVCASAPGKNACQGDSGGPLIVGGYQVGVVSTSYCDLTGPTIAVRVSTFRDWVDQTSKVMNLLFDNEILGAPQTNHNAVPEPSYSLVDTVTKASNNLMDTVTKVPNGYEGHQPDELRK